MWTAGPQARDTLGDARRDGVEAVCRLSELCGYGVSFHDDDLVPFGSDDTERASGQTLRDALDAPV